MSVKAVAMENTNTLTGFLCGSFDINMTGNNLCFFGIGTGKIINGSNVIETCKKRYNTSHSLICFMQQVAHDVHGRAFL